MRKASKYSGPLATPIYLRKLPLQGDLDALVFEEISKKSRALIDHFRIDRALPDEEVWFQLAYSLALRHVPGFRIVNSQKRGVKSKWTLDECRALVDIVNANKTRKGLRAAIVKSIKQPGWKWSRNVRSIEARYHEAVRTIQRFEFLRNRPMEEAVTALMNWYGTRST